MSFITRITVPISNYYRDDVFMTNIYFECETKSPTKEQVIKFLKDQIEEYKQYYKDEGINIDDTDEKEILDVIEIADSWCYVSPTGIVHTNTFVDHPQLGKHPLSFTIIKPTKIS